MDRASRYRTAEQLASTDADTSADLGGGDVFWQDVYERSGGVTTQVSQGAHGGNGPAGAKFVGASQDGARVFFETKESLAPTDTDPSIDIYERSGGVTTQVSQHAQDGNAAVDVAFSGASQDGTRVFFETTQSLASTDTDSSFDIYERSGGVTTQVSQSAQNGNGAFGTRFNGASQDGTRVFFGTQETLAPTDTDSSDDIYERSGGVTTHTSQGAQNGNGPFDVFFRGASRDGTRVFFPTAESLASTDTDSYHDVYERSGGVTKHLSRGAQNGNGEFHASFSGASENGTRVFFETAEVLASSDADSSPDLYERSSRVTTQISRGSQNGNGAFHQVFRGASRDGSRVHFTTGESLAPTDTDLSFDIYSAEDLPRLAIRDVSKLEGDLDTSPFVFTVTLSAPSLASVTVAYTTVDGTAVAPGDYRAKAGTLTFAPGVRTKTISVAVKGDARPEGDERFKVRLRSPTNATVADSTGLGTIRNDD